MELINNVKYMTYTYEQLIKMGAKPIWRTETSQPSTSRTYEEVIQAGGKPYTSQAEPVERKSWLEKLGGGIISAGQGVLKTGTQLAVKGPTELAMRGSELGEKMLDLPLKAVGLGRDKSSLQSYLESQGVKSKEEALTQTFGETTLKGTGEKIGGITTQLIALATPWGKKEIASSIAPKLEQAITKTPSLAKYINPKVLTKATKLIGDAVGSFIKGGTLASLEQGTINKESVKAGGYLSTFRVGGAIPVTVLSANQIYNGFKQLDDKETTPDGVFNIAMGLFGALAAGRQLKNLPSGRGGIMISGEYKGLISSSEKYQNMIKNKVSKMDDKIFEETYEWGELKPELKTQFKEYIDNQNIHPSVSNGKIDTSNQAKMIKALANNDKQAMISIMKDNPRYLDVEKIRNEAIQSARADKTIQSAGIQDKVIKGINDWADSYKTGTAVKPVDGETLYDVVEIDATKSVLYRKQGENLAQLNLRQTQNIIPDKYSFLAKAIKSEIERAYADSPEIPVKELNKMISNQYELSKFLENIDGRGLPSSTKNFLLRSGGWLLGNLLGGWRAGIIGSIVGERLAKPSISKISSEILQKNITTKEGSYIQQLAEKIHQNEMARQKEISTSGTPPLLGPGATPMPYPTTESYVKGVRPTQPEATKIYTVEEIRQQLANPNKELSVGFLQHLYEREQAQLEQIRANIKARAKKDQQIAAGR